MASLLHKQRVPSSMESTKNTSKNYEVVLEDHENQTKNHEVVLENHESKNHEVVLENHESKNHEVVLEGHGNQSSSSNRSYFSELPWHVVLEILLKLPIKALIRCRYVCKEWRVLLLDPSFAKLHQSTTPTGVVLQSSLFPYGKSEALYLLEPQEKQASSVIAEFNHFPYLESVIVNSCNGLICSCDIRLGCPIYISNPITREYLTLPKGDQMKPDDHFVSGFGFSPKTKQYKVIRYSDVAEIYTLGSGTWRRIGHVPPARHCRRFGTFLNEALHWLVKLPDGSVFIRSFDLDTEQFQPIPLPSQFPSFKRSNFGVLQDCLFFSTVDTDAYNWNIEVWVMKQHGVRESWVKEFLIKYPSPTYYCFNAHESTQVVNLLKNGEILLICLTSPVIYNIAQGTFREFEPNGNYLSEVVATAHSSTFVSLKDAAMGESSEVLYF